MKIVKFIIFLLFGLMFIQAGLDKFFHFMPTPQLTEEQKKNIWGYYGNWLASSLSRGC